jgi:predicted Na+-dependent transporter
MQWKFARSSTGHSDNAGFARREEIVGVFCRSKKSLAPGIQMATVLFGAATVGVVLLPAE